MGLADLQKQNIKETSGKKNHIPELVELIKYAQKSKGDKYSITDSDGNRILL